MQMIESRKCSGRSELSSGFFRQRQNEKGEMGDRQQGGANVCGFEEWAFHLFIFRSKIDKRGRRRKPISHGHWQGDPVARQSAAANKLDGARAAASDTPKMPEITEGGHGRNIFFP